MPAITYQDFSGGLDRRLPINVQEASRLWALKNAYITNGKRIKKRPGTVLLMGGLTGTYGLENINGQLAVFALTGSISPAAVSPATLYQIDAPPSGAIGALTDITYAEVFQGYPYVVAKYASGSSYHHYIDTNNSGPMTITIASPAVVTRVGHGFIVGQAVSFTTNGSLPTGVSVGTVYYIIAAGFTADTFQFSTTLGGAAVNTSGAQSGTHKVGPLTWISDANCPHTNGVTKAASRIFAPSGENVRYCAAGKARDWTTSSDAGFLPAGLQQDTKAGVTACGTFQDALVAFFAESAQVWDVTVDPSANQIRKRIYGVGTESYMSLASFANDLMFLSPFGFRSMTVQSNTDRIDDTDVGVQVDSIVQGMNVTHGGISVYSGFEDVRGIWLPQLGQYWAIFPESTGCTVLVYTFSKNSKIACWSVYDFPFLITGIASVKGTVYVRTATSLYFVRDTTYTDDSQLIDVEVQMAFQDAKTPGVAKQWYGADYVVTAGTPEVSFKYDPRDQTKETIAMQIPGDTRPGDMLPVEVVAPVIAPVFRHEAAEAFELDAVTIYYNPLGTV